MLPLFDYFLLHFCSAYSIGHEQIGYDGKNPEAPVQITAAYGSFFSLQLPYPEHIFWQEWKGTKLPFFFGEAPENKNLVEEKEGRVFITVDIVASAFYLLSGWQEYYSQERDQFGRFPYKASMQCRHHFVTLPVVNYYFDILCEALQLATGKKPERKFCKEKTFAVCLTHDIDRCESGWKIAGKAALKKGNISEFLNLLWHKAKGKDNWYNVAEIADLEEQLGAYGTYFFLPSHVPVNGHPNADHNVSQPKYQHLMQQLRRRGHEVGVHGSFGSGSSAEQLQREKNRLQASVHGNRFHYLQYSPENTPAVLEQAGLAYDTSLGFAEHFGFRNSYCLPFRPFDFRNNRVAAFTELPLNLMDTTLRHPNYLMLETELVLPSVEPMLREIMKFGGLFTLLWHNEHFTGYHIPQDKALFVQLAEWCKTHGAKFLTCSQATEAINLPAGR